jgi:hypothetical protein
VVKRPRSRTISTGAPVGSQTPMEAPATVHTSLYLPGPVHETLRKIAFDERVKIHDLVIEGIDAVLKRRGYPSVESLKAGKKR